MHDINSLNISYKMRSYDLWLRGRMTYGDDLFCGVAAAAADASVTTVVIGLTEGGGKLAVEVVTKPTVGF